MTKEYFLKKVSNFNLNIINLPEKVLTCDKIEIICQKHGKYFQIVKNTLKNRKCKKCCLEKLKDNKFKSTQQFVDNAIKKHGLIYDYSKTIYVSSKENVVITCSKHGDFYLKPKYHLNGTKCRGCKIEHLQYLNSLNGNNGWYKIKNAEKFKENWLNIEAYLYQIKCKNGEEIYYKIGITSKKIEDRFKNKFDSFIVIDYVKTNLYDAVIREQSILNDNKTMRFNPKIKFHGHTECFIKQININ